MIQPARCAPQQHWDVIVCGAGPAGSALARRLAGRHRVLVVDRELPSGFTRTAQTWRIGESLPGSAAVLLRRQNLLERFLADGHAERCASVSVWDSVEPVWFDALRDPAGPGWHLDRMRFDAMLRDAAHQAGAANATVRGRLEVQHDGTHWQLADEHSGAQHRARVVVDATGRNAALCRSLGLRRQAADDLVCVHVLLAAQVDDVDRSTRTCADQDGWWYSVRVPSGERVLACHLDADDPALRELRNARVLLERARRLPLLAAVLPPDVGAAQTHVCPAGSVALDLSGCAQRPGFYAVGDAVLAFDPLSSQGLFHTLASADSAASAIEGYLQGNDLAAHAYWSEMQQVQDRYFTHLAATYAGPVRHRERPFWARRLA
ncbi:NAD(P)/FAD-dependent oxidoreductase [Pseudomonas sp. StFLB209]|uniref:NAD(P)/FAD-dependent oxidoreductase n=1 Tax=Pseudomonas sp. StFLB209 TaxID=1028989 RepID=UPI001185B53D|nr:tryptophan 7-halogenase [Pseudomonas sp. StFLB209]